MQDFYIDKLTKSIEDAITGENCDTEIVLITPADVKNILKKNGWRFNWKAEFKQAGRQLYKLQLTGEEVIQGLISIQPLEGYIEMHLIESAPHNYGKTKKYLGVPANMVAFACKMSYDLGFEGFVGFRPKTQLIQHYIDKLGAELIFKDRMSISGNAAKKLVNSYYNNYLDGK